MAENVKRKSGRHDSSKAPPSKKAKSTGEEEQKSSSAQKRQVRKERQSHRRHAGSVTDAKVLWNKLRMKSNTPEDTKELMGQVMKLIRGKVNEIALQHDASRVVQAAVQFGNDEQRRELLEEICDESAAGLAELAKIQYAHFCCLKFIKYCARDDESVKKIVKAFKGSMAKLAVHAVAARVVESLFSTFPPKATAALKQEFYGPHFSLFSQGLSETPTLKSNLDSAKTDTQKESAVTFVKELLSKGMSKSFYGYTYFQELCAEYMDVADAKEIRTLASSVADHSIHLLATRAGAKVVAACASYGTPKDRKRICKSLKGYTSSSLLHRDAYIALLRLIQVTDDTVSIHKSVLNEILNPPKPAGDDEDSPSPLLELALSETASKLLLMLMVDDDAARMKYFDPYEREILEAQATIKENGVMVPTSKKDPAMRRQELMKHITPGLEVLCTTHTEELLKSLPGSRVLKEFYSCGGTEQLANAILEACQSEEEGDEDDENNTDMFEDPVGHRSIKSLILCDEDREDPIFSTKLVEQFGEHFMDIAKSNRGAFVVASLFKVEGLRSEVASKLKPMKKQLKTLSKGSGPTAGYAALLKEME